MWSDLLRTKGIDALTAQLKFILNRKLLWTRNSNDAATHWTREADTLVLRSWIRTCWRRYGDARRSDDTGVTRIDPSQILRGDYGGIINRWRTFAKPCKSRAMPCRCSALTTRFTRWRNYITSSEDVLPRGTNAGWFIRPTLRMIPVVWISRVKQHHPALYRADLSA